MRIHPSVGPPSSPISPKSSRSVLFPEFFEIVDKLRFEIGDFLLKIFLSHIHGPGVPVLFFRIHSKNLHLPEGMNGILNRILQAFSNIPHTTHPGPLVASQCLFIKSPCCDRSRAHHRKISQGESWKVPLS